MGSMSALGISQYDERAGVEEEILHFGEALTSGDGGEVHARLPETTLWFKWKGKSVSFTKATAADKLISNDQHED